MSRHEGAQLVRYFGPVLEALRELGGSGRPTEVTDAVATALNVSEKQQNELMKSGTPRFANQVAWARFYLAKDGYIDSSKKGVWSLTDKGKRAHLTPEESRQIFLRLVKQFAAERHKTNGKEPEVPVADPEQPEPEHHRDALLNLMKKMPPSGFERLCQRLLREAGFRQVAVTGRSGDGGIDGNGVLQVNPFVSFKVLFQCKRYDKSVSPSYIREFQGAMMGRADKGIIMTTGTFSAEARREAVRDGATPIELVDGEKLVEMFENLELGLRPKVVYELNMEFFSDFLSTDAVSKQP